MLAQDARVGVFGLFKSATFEVRSESGFLEISKAPAEDSLWHRLKAGDRVTGRGGVATRFRLRIPGRIERVYEGTLAVDTEADHLRATVTMPLETAVASIVASESVPGATLEA